jgi:hypothetical protein
MRGEPSLGMEWMCRDAPSNKLQNHSRRYLEKVRRRRREEELREIGEQQKLIE